MSSLLTAVNNTVSYITTTAIAGAITVCGLLTMIFEPLEVFFVRGIIMLYFIF
ncbi:MAG: hypothetical protein ACI8SK_000750 [Shewanella sp.]|jgi:hypothetical protein